MITAAMTVEHNIDRWSRRLSEVGAPWAVAPMLALLDWGWGTQNGDYETFQRQVAKLIQSGWREDERSEIIQAAARAKVAARRVTSGVFRNQLGKARIEPAFEGINREIAIQDIEYRNLLPALKVFTHPASADSMVMLQPGWNSRAEVYLRPEGGFDLRKGFARPFVTSALEVSANDPILLSLSYEYRRDHLFVKSKLDHWVTGGYRDVDDGERSLLFCDPDLVQLCAANEIALYPIAGWTSHRFVLS